MGTTIERSLRFLKDDEALTIVEYVVAGGLIAAAIVVAFVALGGDVGAVITYIDQNLCSDSPGC